MDALKENASLALLTLTWGALTAMNLLYWLAIDATAIGIATTLLLVVLYSPAVNVCSQ